MRRRVLNGCRYLRRKDRRHQTENAIKAKLFQHSRMEHGGGRRRGRVGLGSPCVKGKERNQNPETEEKQQINCAAGLDLARRSHFGNPAHVEGADILGHAKVETDQADQKNEAAEGKVNRNLPCRSLPVAGTPDPDKKKGRNEGQLVEHIEKECVNRCKGSDCTGGNEKQTRIKPIPVFRRSPRDAHRGQRYCGR